MSQKNRLTLNGLTTPNFIFILNAAFMIGTSIYLTSHFYDTLFPTTLGGAKGLCDFSSFLNCDAATYSPLSNIAGVPISLFGILTGLLFLISGLMPSESLEKTASAVSRYNLIGCLLLFTYSLIVLGSLCPFCTLYYALSGVAFFLLHRFGMRSWLPDVKTTAGWTVILLASAFFFFKTTQGKQDSQAKMNTSIVEQFNGLADLGSPDLKSEFIIHEGKNPKIFVSVFSDFQCPFCKIVAEQMPELVRKYGDVLSIRYFFYPLDSKCNSNVTGRFHDQACDAAMLAACSSEKFLEVHDAIFAAQEKLGQGALKDIEEKYSLQGCLEKEEIKNKVISTINQGSKFNLKSTPTIIVNGRKIEGTIPSKQFFAIFEDILKK